MRYKIFKHFYLTHSGHLGARFLNNYYDPINRRSYLIRTTANMEFGIMFNLGSLKWKKD